MIRDILYLGCSSGKHAMHFAGGRNAGCSRDCQCSVPVNECADCGDCDYGDNPEAEEIKRQCQQLGVCNG